MRTCMRLSGHHLHLDLSIRLYRGNCRNPNPRDSTLHDACWGKFISVIVVVSTALTLLRQFWCWIGNGSRYTAERYAGEYAWMWAVLVVSVFTYVPITFVALGIRLKFNKDQWCRFEFDRQPRIEGQRRIAISMSMYVGYRLDAKTFWLIPLLTSYPAVYFVLVIPISIVPGSDVPGPAWAQTLGLGWALVGLGLPKVKPDPEPRLGPGSGLVGLEPGLDF